LNAAGLTLDERFLVLRIALKSGNLLLTENRKKIKRSGVVRFSMIDKK